MREIKKDLVGRRFGKLVVQDEYRINVRGKSEWLCKCDCGNEKYITRDHLLRGKTNSCGCIVSTLNNLSKTRQYRIYWKMRERCYSVKHHAYKNYGGKGVIICQEWLDDFMNFYNWSIENGYQDNLTIDRIDSNGNYEPNNCRWITKSENTILANKNRKKK